VPAHEAHHARPTSCTALEQNRHVVTVDAEIAGRARLAVERMLAV
jgi:quinolinate synthase